MTTSIDKEGNSMIHACSSHATHAYGKVHSGLFITIVKGAMINTSKNLGLVTTSSTEKEVVSKGERFPKFTWFSYFRITQGDEDKEDLLYQYDTNYVLSHKKCPLSIGKGTNHVNVRCFFVGDKIEKKELNALHCPTEDMIAEYSTKPTQVGLFVNQGNMIRRVSPENTKMNKSWYERVLSKYDILDSKESDLGDLWYYW